MTRFNTKSSAKTVNLAGGLAYKEDAKLELASILLTSFLKDEFYRSSDATVDRIKELIAEIKDKEFVGKAAVFARTKYGMRSVSHLVAGEIANKVKGEKWTKDFFAKVVHRPDDMTEILSYYGHTYGKPFPNSMKKGFAKAITTFSAYHLAKYRMKGKDVSLVDVVNLVRPKNTDAIRALVKNELKNEDTWEARLSSAGSDKEAKAKVWKDLLNENKLGYFALLRNLRNIIQQATESLPLALKALTDEKRIKESLVLPFRFMSAINEIEQLPDEGVRETLIALNEAIDISLNNVPVFDGKTAVVLDESGSMNGKPFEIGSLFSSILVKHNNADLMLFENNARYLNVNPMDSTLTIARSMEAHGGGTNFHSIFQSMTKAYDRIIILSDMQGWVGYEAPKYSFEEYKRRTNCNPFVYSFDLAGNGTLQMPQDKIYCLAGFSDKTMELMGVLEKDKQALVNEIEKTVLG